MTVNECLAPAICSGRLCSGGGLADHLAASDLVVEGLRIVIDAAGPPSLGGVRVAVLLVGELGGVFGVGVGHWLDLAGCGGLFGLLFDGVVVDEDEAVSRPDGFGDF
jgi:hypothetical protein